MASLGSEDDLRAALSSVLLQDDTAEGIDEDLVEYLAGLLAEAEIGASDLGPLLGVDGSAGPDQDLLEGSPVYELMGPFLESGGCDGRTVGRAVAAVHDLALSGGAGGGSGSRSRAEGGGAASGEATDQARRLRQGVVSISSQLGTETAAEADANRYLWGKDEGVAAFKNEERDAHRDLSSARERRKAKQELERTRREYEDRVRALEEAEEAEIAAGGGAAVSSMILPDYASGRGEKDIQVRNVGLSLGTGRSLLDGAELRFAHGRRYGLVGKNGVGKTTSIAKLAHRYKSSGLKVMLGAADTFRAAAVEQLKVWGQRVGVEVVAQGMGSDPAAVAFDTLQWADLTITVLLDGLVTAGGEKVDGQAQTHTPIVTQESCHFR